MSSDSDYNDENESDSDASVDGPVSIVNYGPWFTVGDPNTFSISRLPDFTVSCGPVDFDPDLKPYDYFEKFLNDEDCCILDVIVEEQIGMLISVLTFIGGLHFIEEMIGNRSPKMK